ncbi:MAG: hypothetical protein ACK56F_05225, partial [bacterium]
GGIITQVTPINSKVINDLPQFKITSTNGSGAILRPILREIDDIIAGDGIVGPGEVGIATDSIRIGQQREVKQVIDCIEN